MRSPDPTMISLRAGVAASLPRIFPGESVREPKLLDVVALALSELVPIYRAEGDGALRRLTDGDMAAGRLLRDADALLVFPDDLERAITRLQAESPDVARARLTLRQGPRAK